MSGQLHTMDATPPAFTAEDASWMVWQKYGIQSVARPMAGERDLNFRITTDEQQDFVLKIWNSTQDPAAVQFQLAALDHLRSADPQLPVPRTMTGPEGEPLLMLKDGAGTAHPAALLTWQEGTFLREADASHALKSSLGATLARLDRALADLRHPGEKRDLLWDICRAGQLRDLAADLEADEPRSAELKDRVERALEEFERVTAPALRSLPRQAIHNDFNPDNILVDPEDRVTVTGIIDFGDLMRSARIADLAVACAYQLSCKGDPVDDLLPMVTGYHAVNPLQAGELAVLTGLVRARLLCSLLITRRMAVLFPHNRDYLLSDNALAIDRLAQLDGLDGDGTTRRLLAACAAAGEQPA